MRLLICGATPSFVCREIVVNVVNMLFKKKGNIFSRKVVEVKSLCWFVGLFCITLFICVKEDCVRQ